MTKDLNDFLGRMERKHDRRTLAANNFDGKVSNDHSTSDWYMEFIDTPDMR